MEKVEDTRPISLTYKEPGSVSTLKKSYRGRLVLPDNEGVIKELMGESDRAAVILATSFLDDLLANAIAMKMNPKMLVADVDKVFRSSGPLGSFSARIEIASLFNIIDDTVYVQLETLREMRNACAHSKHPILLSDPLLKNVAAHFFKNSSVETAIDKLPIKLAFCIEITYLSMVLAYGSRWKAATLRLEALQKSHEEGTPLIGAMVNLLEYLKHPRE